VVSVLEERRSPHRHLCRSQSARSKTRRPTDATADAVLIGIDIKTVKSLGLIVLQTLLASADELIE
jgi:hypothetical protein